MAGERTHGIEMGGDLRLHFTGGLPTIGSTGGDRVYKHNLIILAPGSAEAAGSR
jgi:hypothetical protein